MTMTRVFLLLVLGAVGLTLTAPVAAQELPVNETATPEPENTKVIEVDGTTTVTGYRIVNGSTMVLEIDAQVPRPVTVTDSGTIAKAMIEGGDRAAVKVPRRSLTLDKGSNVVRMDVTKVEGMAAVTVSTSEGMVFLRVGKLDGFEPPVEWSTVQFLLVGVGVGSVSSTYWFVKRKRDREEKGVERTL
jgi:hypothetical protein